MSIFLMCLLGVSVFPNPDRANREAALLHARIEVLEQGVRKLKEELDKRLPSSDSGRETHQPHSSTTPAPKSPVEQIRKTLLDSQEMKKRGVSQKERLVHIKSAEYLVKSVSELLSDNPDHAEIIAIYYCFLAKTIEETNAKEDLEFALKYLAEADLLCSKYKLGIQYHVRFDIARIHKTLSEIEKPLDSQKSLNHLSRACELWNFIIFNVPENSHNDLLNIKEQSRAMLLKVHSSNSQKPTTDKKSPKSPFAKRNS